MLFNFLEMKIYILTILCFLSTQLLGQTFSGIVKGEDSKVVPFANVIISKTSKGTSSKIQGIFSFENIKKGTYQLVVSALGYKKMKQQIEIKEGDNFLQIELFPSSYNLDQVVVTGTMKESFLRASPVKVDVITTADKYIIFFLIINIAVIVFLHVLFVLILFAQLV